MSADLPPLFERLAARYVWWQSPREAALQPRRIITRVMELGDYADVEALDDAVGEVALRDALLHAEVGEFSPRSWHYWHYRLGLARLGEVPPLPQRRCE
ncbi:MAG: hypothetical protein Q8J72_05135 [Rhodocyclaceae bacterium]|jgi:hypothetical protein|nr:hypothetical protein [Rhodocyclaceae bacterium]